MPAEESRKRKRLPERSLVFAAIGALVLGVIGYLALEEYALGAGPEEIHSAAVRELGQTEKYRKLLQNYEYPIPFLLYLIKQENVRDRKTLETLLVGYASRSEVRTSYGVKVTYTYKKWMYTVFELEFRYEEDGALRNYTLKNFGK